MYLAIKCKYLKAVRTVPKTWISYIDCFTHCWLPKNDYCYKLKNRIQPPSETEMKARNELFECDILFDKEYLRFTDAEMDISRLNLGPEWYYYESFEPLLVSSVPDIGTEVEISVELNDLQKYEEYKLLCALHNFKPPIPFKTFEKKEFRYTKTINANDLRPGCRLLNAEEVSRIPRKIDKPFCHPGPEQNCSLYDWYLVDSIVQEVNLESDYLPNFVVRWVGYEDDYNTVEPLAYVKDTAVYKLFVSPDIFTACRSNNGCLRRRSTIRATETSPTSLLKIGSNIYENAIKKLVNELKIEEKAERYSSEIGFFSYKSVADALKAQHQFFIDKFLPLMKELNSTFYMDNHYIGTICGNLQSAAEFKEIAKWSVKNPNTIKAYIQNGLREALKTANGGPHYVSFLVPRKHGTNENTSKHHLNFHMCAYTVRSDKGLKDAIYFDPSPKCYERGVPKALNDLVNPKMQSFTQKFGVASEKDDCILQCMVYLIGLAAREIPFEPNLSQPCRKIDRYMAEKPTKKQKT